MYKVVTASLVNASRVAQLLVELYGPERISQIEQHSECIFWVQLKDGAMAQAVVGADGTLDIQEMEVAF